MSIIFIIVLFIWIIVLTKRVGALEQKEFLARQAQGQAVAQAQTQASAQAQASASALHGEIPSATPQASVATDASLATAASASMPASAPVVHEKEDTEFVWAKYLARAGVAAILLGVAFFLKLAIDYGWIGVMGRVAIGVIVGLIGIVLGQVLRSKYKGYSDVLIGGGLAVLYMTIFFAHHYYHLIGSAAALGLMVGITALAVIMSVVDKAETLARIGIIGGFLAPLLISINHTGLFDLFTYALILDIGVLITAFSRRWHKLNFIAFVGTFILYAVGLAQSFTPAIRVPVLLYTTLFFFLFLAVSVMHHFIRKEKTNSLDVVFLTLNAIWYGLAVYGLMQPVAADFLGFHMLGIAVIYAITALVSFMVDRSDRVLNQYLTGLCVVFLTAAIPMQFDGAWITIMWFLEAVILFAIDYSLKGKNLYSLGGVVFGLGLFRYFIIDKFERLDIPTFMAVFNSRFFMLLAIIVIALVLGYIVKKASNTLPVSAEEGTTDKDLVTLKHVGTFFFIVANLLSIYLLTSEITHYYGKEKYLVEKEYSAKIITNNNYRGEEYAYEENSAVYETQSKALDSLDNSRNVAISIAWAIYATALLVFGFMHKSRGFRIAGLAFIFITLLKVFIDIWNFGGIYRVIGSIVVGVIALIGSFLYAKYKDRIKGALVAGLIAFAVMGGGFALAATPVHQASANAPTVQVPEGIQTSKYVAPINTNNVTGPVMLDIPTAALSKTNINDIRIFDADRDAVPYVALDGNMTTGSESISAAVTNSVTQGNISSAILDIGRTGVIHDSVTLDVTGQSSFVRTVRVYGSDAYLPLNGTGWKTITTDGYIYSYSDSRAGLSTKNTTVTYPKNSFRYLKIEIVGDVAKAVMPNYSYPAVNILGAIVMSVPTAYSVHDMRSVTIAPQHVSVLENAREKSTEITIDLGQQGIYTHQVELSLGNPQYEDPQFIRRAVVQHMNTADGNILGGNWVNVGEANIFELDQPLFSGANLVIPYQEVQSRFIRVIVFNKDDKAIPFSKDASDIKIKSKVRSILFDAKAGENYSMYFGNPAAAKPQYDFASIKAYSDISPAAASLGIVAENTNYIAPPEAQVPWSERNRMVLNVALVILVLVVGGVVYMYVRKIRTGQSQPQSGTEGGGGDGL